VPHTEQSDTITIQYHFSDTLRVAVLKGNKINYRLQCKTSFIQNFLNSLDLLGSTWEGMKWKVVLHRNMFLNTLWTLRSNCAS